MPGDHAVILPYLRLDGTYILEIGEAFFIPDPGIITVSLFVILRFGHIIFNGSGQ